ncbi:zinc finger BED domain-containing RICESLEEPER 1-like [Olea europaea subsp. europaea]|uniref:Zinc finger BED domain-containing RICESLEEPER 1-like n=1 Tax=Olea europaea subsp. europaea TaxID=158383 RepID=A0A8S0UJL9_OLEEU|nr:zinc finger BED domain-containing RICESLEEPER 1-like [Olea europaea subsp. europaea]
MEISDETPSKKPKRLTSVVWNHFERIRKADMCYAICVHCKKKLSGSSNSGTTHLRNHLIRCLKRSNYDVSQLLPVKKRKESTGGLTTVSFEEEKIKEEIITAIPYNFVQEQKKEEINQTVNVGIATFDQVRSQLDLAHMIMLHGYPLDMVDDVGFKIFVKNLQPSFDIMNNSAIELDCMTIYRKEKQKVFEVIHRLDGRINLAVGIWGSPENSEYMCLTANYIDFDWRLQKKMLNFIKLDISHTGDILSEVIVKCLKDWAIDRKLFSMTFDDCSAYDIMVFRIKDWLSQNKPLLRNGELFDVRCVTQLLKSIVQDVMETVRNVTHKIRESIRHIRSSQAIQGKLNEIAQQVGITTERRLVLDCPMQWNSTYMMLEAALEYRRAFSLLPEHDPAYTMALSDLEWEWASSVTGYMKLLVEYTNVFSGARFPTSNIYFPEICDMHIRLIEWCKNPDDFLCSMALKMKNKFDTYWSKCSLVLAVAAILDPRFKMKLVEYYYPQIYGGDAPHHMKEVSDGIRELFTEYSIGTTTLDKESARAGGSLDSTSNSSRDKLKGFDKFLYETSQNQSMTSDLDKYLEEPVFPRNNDFNILNWWKVHTPRYPILSMMARDVLGIPMSTLGQEVAFSTRGRVLDHHRSSLSPDLREALLCGQDWLHMEPEATGLSWSHSALPLYLETS